MSGDGLRFVKFLGVGVLNTAVGLGLYWLFLWLGLSPQPALALAFALGVIWNYLTHARLVFGTGGLSRLAPYIAAYLVLYGLNALTLRALLASGVGAYAAQAILVLPMAAIAFVLISYVLTGRLPLTGAREGE
ncbi:GtrA family protein [Frigidibacter sp. RF13]|uniref:GtrA family protein n=1 Tax=Frigidibacter sp. RF13 TaxID=2997340 RepID=UPI0022714144|nr:GtrA family protein [Frigidibacter sp. RF13]MCY1125276.1 GtrA family protein [Frigidibacter sp. RF13]